MLVCDNYGKKKSPANRFHWYDTYALDTIHMYIVMTFPLCLITRFKIIEYDRIEHGVTKGSKNPIC